MMPVHFGLMRLFMQQLDDFSNGGSQLILWSGNAYPWQEWMRSAN